MSDYAKVLTAREECKSAIAGWIAKNAYRVVESQLHSFGVLNPSGNLLSPSNTNIGWIHAR
ncbi:hypothetical protein GNF10_04470 [Nostoc sp. UCD121]|uniref:hypothetical protein n=1 Tax=unclassified Nostoc TaxID=2593658 RepID=UPI0016236FC6|nr:MULTISPECIES: hypothetical protein [unclassified Nostoc]MBC1221056.1 hypothetical protein [Nostoc sp. UCD120]MBC1275257.1 hypothetical protein [Nostoc sp. UCD121]MBC1299781.1 hypothetical protein [Nostoc sp. UCD122]